MFRQRQTDELTVAELVDEFLSVVKVQVRQGNLAERTLEWYDVHLQCFAKSIGTELLISQLRPLHVRKWLDKSYAKSGNNHQKGRCGPSLVIYCHDDGSKTLAFRRIL